MIVEVDYFRGKTFDVERRGCAYFFMNKLNGREHLITCQDAIRWVEAQLTNTPAQLTLNPPLTLAT